MFPRPSVVQTLEEVTEETPMPSSSVRSSANVVATVCLFVVLGGSSLAAPVRDGAKSSITEAGAALADTLTFMGKEHSAGRCAALPLLVPSRRLSQPSGDAR
jgi:hypothetical protein